MALTEAKTRFTVLMPMPCPMHQSRNLAASLDEYEDAPTEATLEDDLIIAAYARGADGITDISHRKESGLMKNCWHIQFAQGTIFRLP